MASKQTTVTLNSKVGYISMYVATNGKVQIKSLSISNISNTFLHYMLPGIYYLRILHLLRILFFSGMQSFFQRVPGCICIADFL